MNSPLTYNWMKKTSGKNLCPGVCFSSTLVNFACLGYRPRPSLAKELFYICKLFNNVTVMFAKTDSVELV